MAELNPQAEQLNETIKSENPLVYDLLSRRGKAIFFPKEGILAQGQEAKGKEINATLIRLEGDKAVLRLAGDKIYKYPIANLSGESQAKVIKEYVKTLE